MLTSHSPPTTHKIFSHSACGVSATEVFVFLSTGRQRSQLRIAILANPTVVSCCAEIGTKRHDLSSILPRWRASVETVGRGADVVLASKASQTCYTGISAQFSINRTYQSDQRKLTYTPRPGRAQHAIDLLASRSPLTTSLPAAQLSQDPTARSSTQNSHPGSFGHPASVYTQPQQLSTPCLRRTSLACRAGAVAVRAAASLGLADARVVTRAALVSLAAGVGALAGHRDGVGWYCRKKPKVAED